MSDESELPFKYADPRLLDLAGVAKLLCLTKPIVRRMASEGRLPSPIEIGKHTRWIREDIVRFVNLAARDCRKVALRQIGQRDRSTVALPQALCPIRGVLVDSCTTPGVYFLMKADECVYVGSALNPNRRIPDHRDGTARTSKKDFDFFLIFPVSIEELIETERTFVAILNPRLNINLRTVGSKEESYGSRPRQ